MYVDFELGTICEVCAKAQYQHMFTEALQAKLLTEINSGKCSICKTKKHAIIQKRVKRK